MKSTDIILILVLGSIWGFFEIIGLPIYVVCAIAILILTTGRKLVNIPGTSILIGLVVCFYKTYSDSFFICQWAGIMSLAGSFDLLTSLVFKTIWEKPLNTALIGVLTNIIGMIGFLFVAFAVFQEPNWIAGGLDKILNYTLVTVIPATLLSGLFTANIGLFIGTKIKELNSLSIRKFIPGFYLTTTLLLWIIASIR
ncbi:hypothetical protein ASZ90_005055 [hydrocarbon metagenome]|uniref:Uncharacterized protein n=1 Tax=hydrocarbon metagenome TaxID=938273 RepID=A0A0W8FWA6_9ZZZZ